MYLYDHKKKISLGWLRAVCTALQRDNGVTIKRGDKWAADMDSKTIIYDENVVYLDEDTALGLLLHEIGHIRHTTKYNELKSSKQLMDKFPSLTKMSINFLEDPRIDEKMSNSYANSRAVMENLLMQALGETLHGALDYNDMQKKEKQTHRYDEDDVQHVNQQIRPEANLVQIYGLATLIYYLGEENLEGLVDDYHDKTIAKKAKEVAKEMEKGNVSFLKNTEEISELFMNKIYPIVKEYFNEEEEEQNQQAQDNNSQGSGASGYSPQELEGLAEYVNDVMDKDMFAEDLQKAIQPFTKIKGDGSFKDKAKEKIRKALGAGDEEPTCNMPKSYEDTLKEINPLVATSKAKFNRILKDNKYDRYNGKFSSGQLNMKRLYKQKIGDYKLFQRKTEIQDKSYACSMLIDLSGSMSGQPFEETMKGLILMSEVFNKTGVDFQIIPYSSQHSVAKEFGEGVSSRKINNEMSRVYGGGTIVRKPYEYAVESLKRHKANKKFLILLSDGEFWDMDSDEMRDIVRKNASEISQYGIGLDIDMSDKFEDNAINVKDYKEIVPAFSKILNKNLKKRHG